MVPESFPPSSDSQLIHFDFSDPKRMSTSMKKTVHFLFIYSCMNDKLSKERWRKREGKIHNKSNKKTRRKTSDNSTQVDQDSSIQLLKQSTRLWLNYWAADHNRRSPSCRSVRIEHVVVNHCSVLMRETSTKVHGMF